MERSLATPSLLQYLYLAKTFFFLFEDTFTSHTTTANNYTEPEPIPSLASLFVSRTRTSVGPRRRETIVPHLRKSLLVTGTPTCR